MGNCDSGSLRRDSAGLVDSADLCRRIAEALGTEVASYVAELIDRQDEAMQRWREASDTAERIGAERDNFRTIANRLGARLHALEEQLAKAREWSQQLRAIL